MPTIARTIEISAAHRLPFEKSKEQRIHGHNFLVTLEVTGDVSSPGFETVQLQALRA